jgi:hypothetical protein
MEMNWPEKRKWLALEDDFRTPWVTLKSVAPEASQDVRVSERIGYPATEKV